MEPRRESTSDLGRLHQILGDMRHGNYPTGGMVEALRITEEDNEVRLPRTMPVLTEYPLTLAEIAALYLVADVGVQQARRHHEVLERVSEDLQKLAMQHRLNEAQARAHQFIIDLSTYHGPIRLIRHEVLSDIGGVSMELELGNLQLSYTDRDHDLPTVHVCSSTHYTIVEFALEIELDGIDVSQLNQLKAANHNASWEGYHDNIAKYGLQPRLLEQVYTRELLDKIKGTEIGTAVIIDIFDGDKPGSNVYNIATHRILRTPEGKTVLRENGKPADVINLMERHPELRTVLEHLEPRDPDGGKPSK